MCVHSEIDGGVVRNRRRSRAPPMVGEWADMTLPSHHKVASHPPLLTRINVIVETCYRQRTANLYKADSTI